ncbi:hypothetical protein SASPL_120445 [Salvia splendens]|uniref:Uncharacterized protein n=1 Tax=Salvia splendens TaxID=180675 RepID=A0A8X8ZW92_SALSN|nr:hypothetical protein SASPL_120445 [Salvia splendens]
MCTSSDSGSGSGSGSGSNGWTKARGVVLKTLVLMGGALLLKRLTKSTTRWDHARIVADSLAGEKFSREQASRDPDNYFNLRWLSCPAAEMVDGSRVLYFEQVEYVKILSWMCLTLQGFFIFKIFNRLLRDRHSGELLTNLFDRNLDAEIFHGKALLKEMKCDVEDIAEHLTTIYLKRCDRGKRCLYEGSTPSDGFPNTWNGASYCTSELTVLKNSEIHTSDIGYDYEGNQVWGVKGSPYEFKPAPASSFSDPFSSLTIPPQFTEKRIEGSFVLQN